MHDDMVERVARAIWIASGFGPDGFSPDGFYQRPYMDKARAAIEAMREPSRKMVTAGADIDIERAGNDETNSTYELWGHEVIAMWRAMIDAALQKDAEMHDDIVERLRSYLTEDQVYRPVICSEAADEIERLRAQLERGIFRCYPFTSYPVITPKK